MPPRSGQATKFELENAPIIFFRRLLIVGDRSCIEIDALKFAGSRTANRRLISCLTFKPFNSERVRGAIFSV